MALIDMQTMRYINLLDRESKVKTRKCFVYNNSIIFAVPREMISRALGPNAINVRKIQEKLGKRIRIIAEASGTVDAQRFIEDVVYPIKFKNLEIKEEGFILNAGSQSKAALIGRNKRRLIELDKIVQDTFGKELKII